MAGIFRYIAALVIVVLISTLAFAEVIKDGSFQAVSDGSNITLRWMVDNEANVTRYEIEKRNSADAEFKTIAFIEPRSLAIYEFIDYSGMEKISSLFQYRIKVVFSNGANPQYVGPVSVIQSVSGVRKTWGSIKALFR